MNDYVTLEEAARRANVAVSTLRKYVAQGAITPRVERQPDRAAGYRLWFSQADIRRAQEVAAANLRNLKIGLREYVDAMRRQRDGDFSQAPASADSEPERPDPVPGDWRKVMSDPVLRRIYEQARRSGY
jgi:DNA-binding transcriptional MerR regulator